MRILHIITGLVAGGAEDQLDLLLQHTRHDAEVVTFYNFGSVGRRIAQRGTRVHDLDMPSSRQVSRVFRLARMMRRGAYDVVHVHLYRACVYGRLAARLAGVPVVVTTEHSLGETQIEGRSKTFPVRLLYLATEPFSDATIAVSPKVRKLLIEWGVTGKKIRVIPNGLEPDHYAFDHKARERVREEFGIPADAFVVGSVGRLHRVKRYDRLIEAAAPILMEDGRSLVLVGEGSERHRLQRLAEEAGVAGRTVFAGEREDVPRLLSAMDVFVSPSEEETFGLAALEAAAAGLRVIAADCPALDGTSLADVRRVPADVPSLRRALLEENPLKSASRRAKRLPERYDIRTVAAAVDDLYESLHFSRARQSTLGRSLRLFLGGVVLLVLFVALGCSASPDGPSAYGLSTNHHEPSEYQGPDRRTGNPAFGLADRKRVRRTRPTPVLLAGDDYYSVLAAVRGLRAAGYAPWLAIDEPGTYAARSRATAGTITVPDPSFDGEGFVREVAAAATRLGVAAVLPSAESHLLALAGRDADFAGIAFGAPSREMVERATDKGLLPELTAAAGLQTPPTVRAVRGDSEAVGTFGFPAIVKPPRKSRIQTQNRRVSSSTRYVSSEQEADEALAALPGEEGLVQPCIPGRLVSVSGVSWEGELVCALHQISVRTWPVPAGVSAYAETIPPNPELERGVGRLLRAIGWSGLFQAQFVCGPQDEHYLIDLNPRIYGSIALAIAAGLNLPGIWADLLLGGRPEVGGYRVGVRYRHEEKDARALARMLVNGVERRHAFRGLLPRRDTTHAVFSLRDPMPLLTSAAKLVRWFKR